MVKLFKDGDHMGIETDAPFEESFKEQFARLLSDLIEAGTYDSDWEFQLERWLTYYADIVCAYRGYENEVTRKHIICAGPEAASPCGRLRHILDRQVFHLGGDS